MDRKPINEEPGNNVPTNASRAYPMGNAASNYYSLPVNHDIQLPGAGLYPESAEPLPEPSFPLGGYTGAWGDYLGSFGFPAEQPATEQLTPEQLAQLDEYLNSFSQPAAAPETFLPAPANSEYDPVFSQTSEAGRQLYSEAYSQWAAAGLNSSLSPDSQLNYRAAADKGAYNPFGIPQDAFSNGSNGGGEEENHSQFTMYGNNEQKTSPSAATVSSKPSFAEVAKNASSQTSFSGKESVVKNGISAPKPHKSSEKKEHIHSTAINSNKSLNSRKVKSSKVSNNHSVKSAKVPVEVPAEIKPHSRYGLDTFDERMVNNNSPKDCQGSGQGSVGSRKNSGSSISSGVSGLEEGDNRQYCDHNTSLSSDCCDFASSKQARVPSSSLSSDCDYSSKQAKIHSTSSEKKTSSNKPAATAPAATKKKPHKPDLYFDPRKIFQESNSHKSVQTNNEDFVPNNKQKIPTDKESLLNKEKSKASVKSGSTKYINNDLRDNKKHINVESEQQREQQQGSSGREQQQQQQQGSSGREQQPQQGSSGREARCKAGTVGGSVPRSRGKAAGRAETAAANHQGRAGGRGVGGRRDKTPDNDFILGHWLLLVYDWSRWFGRELAAFLWGLLKLVLSVTLLLCALIAHYSIRVCSKLWSFLQEKVPYLNRRKKEAPDFDWSNPMSPPRQKQYGLKDNIILPSTGNEAMKRLLSCKGKDPYSILGMRGDASDDDIKKYYRKQAVLVHPDKNKQPGAEEAFKILGHAFDLIGSTEKRQEYDAHLEMKDAEDAMQEFADLLTKLHEKMQEANNLLRCDSCGGKHKRVSTDRPTYAARFCDRCNTRHPAKEGDVWAESRMLGFLWHYYACMDSKVYDITEWASCKRDNFKSMQANAHQVIYRLQTGTGRAKSATPRAGDANLEDFLSNLFHHTSQASATGGQPNGEGPPANATGPTSANSSKPQNTKTSRKKKTKKH